MAKTVNETQLKTRKTKLGKKSSEELINIILRKDDVERKLNKQIVNLKTEVNDLNSKVKALQSDIEDVWNEYERSTKKLHCSCVEKSRKINHYKGIIMIAVIYSIVMTLLWVFSY